MLSRANIVIALITIFTPKSLIEGVMHPTTSMHDAMTCDEFTKTSRFNPYSVIKDVWMVFYYWAPPLPHTEYKFAYPGPKERAFLKRILDDKYVTIPVNWTARVIVLRNIGANEHSLLVEKGDRGQFWLYPYAKGTKKGQKMEPVDARLKQTGDNKYIGFMICDKELVYVLTRVSSIPRQSKIQDEAARIGYRGRDGKSYLYQGHNWAPVDEMDEDEYWHPEKYEKKLNEDLRVADMHLAWEQGDLKRKRQKAQHDDHVEKDILA